MIRDVLYACVQMAVDDARFEMLRAAQLKLAEFDMTVEPNRNVEELPRHPDGPREPRPSERVSVSE